MKLKIDGLGINCAALLLVVTSTCLSGCAMMPGGKGSVDLNPKSKLNYATTCEAAVKACRELDLPLNLYDKDAGQIQCGLKSSEVHFFSAGYSVDALIEHSGQSVKNINVKVAARNGGYWGLATDSDANSLAQRYIDILRRNNVR